MKYHHGISFLNFQHICWEFLLYICYEPNFYGIFTSKQAIKGRIADQMNFIKGSESEEMIPSL